MTALLLWSVACGDGGAPPPPPITPKALQIVSGDGQRALRGGDLAAPLRVRLIGSDDEPLSGTAVRWTVTEGQATIEPAQSTTGPSGEAETRVTLGATLGSVVVRATVADLTPVLFSSTTVDAAAIEIVSGDRQRSGAGRPLFGPLRVRVIASDDLPLEGVTVQWSVSQGQATLDPAQSTTDASGVGETRVTVGPATGSILVSATVEELAPLTFSITVLEPSAFISVSAGSQHTCGLSAAGDAYCWGSNADGRLGDGTTMDRQNPVLVLGGLSFARVSAGHDYTCGVSFGGAAYCWGYNGFGRLGDGTMIHRLAPVPVSGGLSFASVSGGIHTCGLTTAGAAYCWGQNDVGELGRGTATVPECAQTTCSIVPVPVAGGLSLASLDLSQGGVCGITAAGVTYCWGSNFDGRLGIGTVTGPQTCGGSECSTVPVPVQGGLSFVAVSAGVGFHTCGIITTGAAYCWGANTLGELGVGMTTGPETCDRRICSTLPVPVVGGLAFTEMSAGYGHTCAVTAAGAAYCWGYNDTGQLGIGTAIGPETCQNSDNCSTLPAAVAGGLSFVAVGAGRHHTCGVTGERRRLLLGLK